MPMMIVCDKLAYMPGQVVTGHVVVISKSPQKIKGLTMRFIGRSSKLLGEIEGTKRYKKEVYFDEKIDIFGHDGSNTQLQVGETLYPFTFPLKTGLPSSFEWSDGNVLYFVEAKLTRVSWKDKRATTRLQVEGVYDLNLEPSAMAPIEVKRQKYVKHLLSKSGPYGFTFKCNRSAFIKGHSLPFSIEIRNLSKVDSRKVKISLLQEVKINDDKSNASLVEQMKGPAVTAGEVITWEARLKIPGGIPPTNLGNILSYPAVIPVLYFLHIQLSLKNYREEPLCIKIPVTIGTIPMQRRALSVPALDINSNSRYSTYTSNGHRVDCPMSQFLLPSPAISASQFSPHLVSRARQSNNMQMAPRGPGYPPSYHHTFTPRNRLPPMHPLLGPARQYEYYFEYEDSSGTTRSVTSRGGGNPLLQRRRHNNYAYYGRPVTGRVISNLNTTRESPPPSYDEIFARERQCDVSRIVVNQTLANDTNSLSHERILPGPNNTSGQEMIQKRAICAQLSSPSSLSSSSSQSSSSSCASEEDDDEDSSLSLVLPLSNDGSSSGNSGRLTPESSSSDSEHEEDDEDEAELDDDNCSAVVSANDEFISCSGIGNDFEKLKCYRDLQSKNGLKQQLRDGSVQKTIQSDV